MSNIIEFKESHKQFTLALKYMVENQEKLEKDPKRWKLIKENFKNKFSAPLDLSWNSLSKEEQKSLAPLYLHRKAQQIEIIQKALKIFNGKIVKGD